MFAIFLRALRAHGWLRLLCAALALSSVGNGLTYLLIYAELHHLQATAGDYALTFALSCGPGLLGSWLGTRLLQYYPAARLILLSECLGLVCLILPVLALGSAEAVWLQCLGAASSFAGSLALPAFVHYAKNALENEELPALAMLESLIFASHVLLGIGLGVLLYPLLGSAGMLWLDAASFILAILLLSRLPPLCQHGQQSSVIGLPAKLAPAQQRSLLLLPALTLVGAPAMALLPALSAAHTDRQILLALLFSRSLGQLCGPLLVRDAWLARLPQGVILLCLAGFIACYQLLTVASTWYWLLLFVFTAHLLSNIVFSLGWLGILQHFDSQHAAAASASNYRHQEITAGGAAMIAGWLAENLGAGTALLVCSSIGWLAAAGLLYRYRQH